MAVRSVNLTSQEAYLLALILDDSGIDLAEFLWEDPTADNKENIFRAWDFQYSWWRDTSKYMLDQCSRSVGKTQSIVLRGWRFPIAHPGSEMVVTAPELVHLQPLVGRIEEFIKKSKLTGYLLPGGPGKGFKHKPFQVDFNNGARIIGRIPQRDGKGVKGLHPLRLELDEAQDYVEPGWIELVETLRELPGAQWRAHGVSRGVRDTFYKFSQPGSGWSVHNITAMHRPSWTDEERQAKIKQYGSRNSPDYRRNILGVHGDATNPLFVLHRLMACVDDNEASAYNLDIYYRKNISDELIDDLGGNIGNALDFPMSHKEWKDSWIGMDVGMTNAPSEILVFGEEPLKGKSLLRLLTRVQLSRVRSSDQRKVLELIFDFYQPRLLTMDRGGLGLPMYQELQDAAPRLMNRVTGYNADQKVVVGYEPYEQYDDPKDYEITARAKEYGYDLLRQYVDTSRFILPWDMEILQEWQGQTWVREKSSTSPYGNKRYSAGKFHTLDAAAMMVLGKELKAFESVKQVKQAHERVPLMFA